jgi:two-component system, OmpR family, sensor histidine kinase ChvG
MARDEIAPWQGRGSLTRRILAVNIVALALMAGSLFYLDNFRVRLIEERRAQAEGEAQIAAAAINAAPRRARQALIETLGKRSGDRLRLFDNTGKQLLDSWTTGPRTYGFDGRADEPWDNEGARWVDRVAERIVGANVPDVFVDAGEKAKDWPELQSVMSGATVASRVWLAPDRTLIVTAAAAVNLERTRFVLSVGNTRDVTKLVRAERFRLAIIVLGTLFLSIALSLFLARTIVTPLRRLAQAAIQVRLGRSRDVIVPRLPDRNDEIGMLARAVSDMTQALRERLDATETFAADVAHELKNPLASMASAVESLGKTSDPAITAQLHAILSEDVRRLDRSVTDISELSRLDGELSRTNFETIDVVAMLDTVVAARDLRRGADTPAVSFDKPQGRMRVMGDEPRLVRAVENLIENAVSFSPSGAGVTVSATRIAGNIAIHVDDSGPGVPPERREAIFRRFHSERPDGDFARHSGLGLAIAKTIVEAMGGSIAVEDAPSGGGARFAVRLPVA